MKFFVKKPDDLTSMKTNFVFLFVFSESCVDADSSEDNSLIYAGFEKLQVSNFRGYFLGQEDLAACVLLICRHLKGIERD